MAEKKYEYDIRVPKADLKKIDDFLKSVDNLESMNFTGDFDMSDMSIPRDLDVKLDKLSGHIEDVMQAILLTTENPLDRSELIDAMFDFKPDDFLKYLGFDKRALDFAKRAYMNAEEIDEFTDSLGKQLGKAMGQGQFDLEEFQSTIYEMRDELAPKLEAMVEEIDIDENLTSWYSEGYETRTGKSTTKGKRVQELLGRMSSNEKAYETMLGKLGRVDIGEDALTNEAFNIYDTLEDRGVDQEIIPNFASTFAQAKRRRSWIENDKDELESLLMDMSSSVADPILTQIDKKFGEVSSDLAKEMKSIYLESLMARGQITDLSKISNLSGETEFIGIMDEILTNVLQDTTVGFGTSATPKRNKIVELFEQTREEITKLSEGLKSGNLAEIVDQLTESEKLQKKIGAHQSPKGDQDRIGKIQEKRQQETAKNIKKSTPQFMTKELKNLGQQIAHMDTNLATSLEESMSGVTKSLNELKGMIESIKGNILRER